MTERTADTDATNDTETTAETSAVTPAVTPAVSSADTADHQHGYLSDKARYLARLRRIEGQARGIHKMIESEQYCIDILTQISAMTRALEGVAIGLLDEHLRHCVVDAAQTGGDEAEIKLSEASDAIARLVRS